MLAFQHVGNKAVNSKRLNNETLDNKTESESGNCEGEGGGGVLSGSSLACKATHEGSERPKDQ